jgi:hypothetical protein
MSGYLVKIIRSPIFNHRFPHARAAGPLGRVVSVWTRWVPNAYLGGHTAPHYMRECVNTRLPGSMSRSMGLPSCLISLSIVSFRPNGLPQVLPDIVRASWDWMLAPRKRLDPMYPSEGIDLSLSGHCIPDAC